MKRTLPLLITFCGGVVLIFAHFVPPAQSLGDTMTTWFNILAAFAFVLGAGSLLKAQLRKVSDRQPGWGYAAVTLGAFLITMFVGLLKIGTTPQANFPDKPWAAPRLDEGGAFWWIYEYAFQPLGATMFSLLAFFVASAAFRAFRAKNVEAFLLLATAFIILLGRTYAGTILTGWLPNELGFLKTDNLTMIIMSVFNTAGARAVLIGIALGIVATSLKVILGVDRSYLGSDRE